MATFRPTVTSAGNSSTTVLSGNTTFTGDWVEVSAVPAVSVYAGSDKAGTLYVDFSDDAGTALDTYRSEQLSSGVSGVMGHHVIPTGQKWFRVRVVNGANNQASFTLETRLHRHLPVVVEESSEAIDEVAGSTLTTSYQMFSLGEVPRGAWLRGVTGTAVGAGSMTSVMYYVAGDAAGDSARSRVVTVSGAGLLAGVTTATTKSFGYGLGNSGSDVPLWWPGGPLYLAVKIGGTAPTGTTTLRVAWTRPGLG